jgi:hypothetical protein
MRWTDEGEKWRAWLVDYSAARTRAIEWLGDRYLLAKPINRREASWLHDGRPRIRKGKATGSGAPADRGAMIGTEASR